jgi:hypothetical protein
LNLIDNIIKEEGCTMARRKITSPVCHDCRVVWPPPRDHKTSSEVQCPRCGKVFIFTGEEDNDESLMGSSSTDYSPTELKWIRACDKCIAITWIVTLLVLIVWLLGWLPYHWAMWLAPATTVLLYVLGITYAVFRIGGILPGITTFATIACLVTTIGLVVAWFGGWVSFRSSMLLAPFGIPLGLISTFVLLASSAQRELDARNSEYELVFPSNIGTVKTHPATEQEMDSEEFQND